MADEYTTTGHLHSAGKPEAEVTDGQPTDPRITRCREIAEELARAPELTGERRRLLAELRDEGWKMAGLARAVGLSREYLYELIGARAPKGTDGQASQVTDGQQ